MYSNSDRTQIRQQVKDLDESWLWCGRWSCGQLCHSTRFSMSVRVTQIPLFPATLGLSPRSASHRCQFRDRNCCYAIVVCRVLLNDSTNFPAALWFITKRSKLSFLVSSSTLHFPHRASCHQMLKFAWYFFCCDYPFRVSRTRSTSCSCPLTNESLPSDKCARAPCCRTQCVDSCVHRVQQTLSSPYLGETDMES